MASTVSAQACSPAASGAVSSLVRLVALHDLPELVARGDDLHGVIITSGGSRLGTPVWAATVGADEDLLAALLAPGGPEACRAQVNVQDTDSGCYPLHCAAKLRILGTVAALVGAGADVNAQNADLFGLNASGFRLLPECGGKSALHLLCAGREDGDTVEACRGLVTARADVNLKDCLGLTALDVAQVSANSKLSDLLVESGATFSQTSYSKDEVQGLCLAREAAWQARKLAEQRQQRRRSLEHLRRSYRPLDIRLFEPAFLAGHAAQALAVAASSGLPPATELATGVFGIESLFPPDLCSRLLDELDALGAWAQETGFDVARPNSMNRYGMVLNDLGFQEAMHALMKNVVAPLAQDCFSSSLASLVIGEWPSFLSQHSFVVRYRVGEDVDLKTHRDDSEVTLNICLGRSFDGADVYFHAPPGEQCACAREGKADEYVYPHPKDCAFCTYRHRHAPGTALLHLGKHVHGVDSLRAGERVNLIVWCRLRPYPPEMAEEETEDGAAACVVAPMR